MSWGALLAAGTGALVLAEHWQHAALRVLAKLVAVFAFLAAAIEANLHNTDPSGQAIFAALLASALGDVILLGRSENALLGGLGAFLLAHVGYVVALSLIHI